MRRLVRNEKMKLSLKVMTRRNPRPTLEKDQSRRHSSLSRLLSSPTLLIQITETLASQMVELPPPKLQRALQVLRLPATSLDPKPTKVLSMQGFVLSTEQANNAEDGRRLAFASNPSLARLGRYRHGRHRRYECSAPRVRQQLRIVKARRTAAATSVATKALQYCRPTSLAHQRTRSRCLLDDPRHPFVLPSNLATVRRHTLYLPNY